ncbi:hypothetical protein GCM10009099_05480 [Caenispirillum bisanense]
MRRVRQRRKARSWRSVQSIIGATDRRRSTGARGGGRGLSIMAANIGGGAALAKGAKTPA